LFSGHKRWVWGLEQTFPGSPMFFTSSVDETVRVWDIRLDNPCVAILDDFQGAVAGIALNPAQNRLICGAFDVSFHITRQLEDSPKSLNSSLRI